MDEALFFKQHQQDLLKIANSEEGRFLLGHKGNEPIIKVTPESFHMPTGFGRDHKAVFFTDNRLGYKIGQPFHKLLLANTYKNIGNKRKGFLHYANLETNYAKYPQIYLVTAPPFNPASGEGTMRRDDELSWAAARDATTADSVGSGAQIESTYTGDPSQFYLCYRAAQPFDTASLTASALVKTPITFEAYRDDSQITGANPFANQSSTTIVLVQSTQSDPTTLTTADFDNLSFVSKGSQALSGTSNGAYSISVSITDTTLIQNQGYTKLYAITGLDLSNTSPGSGASATSNRMAWQTRAQANPAKLTVTYDPIGAALFFALAM